MSNFFGMSQINGHLPGSIANPMPSMALPFTAPPSMTLHNSMQMPVSASTSAASGLRQTPIPPGGMKTKQRTGSDNLIKCAFCPKKFSSNQIDGHRNECRQIRCHECSQCGKRFKARGGLQQHNRIHLQERPYGCRFCPKRFTQKSHLDQHERIHTGLKPFQCQFCGRSFRQRSQQIGHEATHPQGASSMNNSSSSSGIFSANTTGSDSDQSCNNSPINAKDKVSALQMVQSNAMLSMLAPGGAPGMLNFKQNCPGGSPGILNLKQGGPGNPGLLNLKQGTLELISGR
ncbi:hypothetical protein FO519_003650 [Halicephalobus sp. NKZ332]|nr:hypothetical protein FO519_003650 [Halicephalobus sp. NKZ332]